MIFISAGFDAHRDDELGQLGLVEADYAWITEQIKARRRRARGRPHRLVPRRRLQPRRAGAQRRRAPARADGCVSALAVERAAARCGLGGGLRRPRARRARRRADAAGRGRRAGDPRRLPARRLDRRAPDARPRPAGRLGLVRQPDRRRRAVPGPRARASPSRARVALAATVKPAVFKVAIPILISLVVIRLSVRVLSAHLPRRRAGCARSSAASRGWPGSPSCSGSPASRRWCSTRWTTCAGRSATRQITLRNLVEGGVTAGIVLVLALWVSAAIETQAALERQRPRPVAAQDRRQRRARAAAVRRPAARAVGGRHRPDRAVGARRRDRRRPRLRPAEDRRQLHQRLRHPRRAQPAHRRHGQGRHLRGPHHRHPHPLHRDPLAQRARGDRAERDADHDSASRTRRSPIRACSCRRRCRSPTAPTCARCSRKLEAAIAAVPRVIADPGAVGAARGVLAPTAWT